MSDEINTKDKSKSKLSFFDRLKNLKKTEWIIVIVLISVAILIYSSTSSLFVKNDTTNVTTNEYVNELEKRLSKVLSGVKGAGRVNVMITLESGAELVLATSTEEKVNNSNGTSNSSQSTTTIEKPIIVGSEPVVLIEKYPQIKGVIVVAQGASNIQVRLELLRAVQALLEVNASNIEVFVGN